MITESSLHDFIQPWMYDLVLYLNNKYTYSCTILVLSISFINLLYIKKCDRGRTLTMHALFWTFVFTCFTPVIASSFCLFWSIQTVMGIVLKIIYGSRFIGFFSNYDAVHARSKTGKCTINVLLITECEDPRITADDIFKSVSNTIHNAVILKNKDTGKLMSTLRHLCGYRFLLKRNDVVVGDCVKKMKTLAGINILTKSELMDLLADYTTEPFPFDNEFLWDVNVGGQPVAWKVPDKKYYPILFRFHHSLADGVNIISFITGVCGFAPKEDEEIYLQEKPSAFINHCKTLRDIIICYLLLPAIIYTNLVTRNNNLHLNIPYLRGKRASVVIKVEEVNSYYKRILEICKNCEVSFTSVLGAAFSASINDYYMTRYDSAPEYLTMWIPTRSDALELLNLQPGSKSIDQVNFTNDYQLLFVELPIQPQDVPNYNKSSMIDRLGLVVESIQQEKQRFLFRRAVNQFLKIHFTLSPAFIIHLSTYYVEGGPIISNIPGTPKMCLGEQSLPVSDYVFYVPDIKRSSFVLTVTTYDNRLHLSIGTSVDIKRKELLKMLNNVYKYIDVLEDELDYMAKNSSDSLRQTQKV